MCMQEGFVDVKVEDGPSGQIILLVRKSVSCIVNTFLIVFIPKMSSLAFFAARHSHSNRRSVDAHRVRREGDTAREAS